MIQLEPLSPHHDAFIKSLVESGEYPSAQAAVHAALDLLEKRQRSITALRAALIEGEESGTAEDSSLESILKELDARRKADA